jgi:TolA protein
VAVHAAAAALVLIGLKWGTASLSLHRPKPAHQVVQATVVHKADVDKELATIKRAKRKKKQRKLATRRKLDEQARTIEKVRKQAQARLAKLRLQQKAEADKQAKLIKQRKAELKAESEQFAALKRQREAARKAAANEQAKLKQQRQAAASEQAKLDRQRKAAALAQAKVAQQREAHQQAAAAEQAKRARHRKAQQQAENERLAKLKQQSAAEQKHLAELKAERVAAEKQALKHQQTAAAQQRATKQISGQEADLAARQSQQQTQQQKKHAQATASTAAPHTGFTLKFNSSAAFNRMLAGDSIRFYVFSGSQSWQVSFTGGAVQFNSTSPPQSYYKMAHTTVPAQYRQAFQDKVAAANGGSVVWGVVLPSPLIAKIKQDIAGQKGGDIVINGDGSIDVRNAL